MQLCVCVLRQALPIRVYVACVNVWAVCLICFVTFAAAIRLVLNNRGIMDVPVLLQHFPQPSSSSSIKIENQSHVFIPGDKHAVQKRKHRLYPAASISRPICPQKSLADPLGRSPAGPPLGVFAASAAGRSSIGGEPGGPSSCSNACPRATVRGQVVNAAM